MLHLMLGYGAKALLAGGVIAVAAAFPHWTVRADITYSASDSLAEGEVVHDTLTYTIRDIHGAESVGTVDVTVTGVNDPPVAADVEVSMAEDNADETVPFPGSDVDSDDSQPTLNYAIDETTPNWLTNPDVLVNNGDGSFTIMPGADSLQSLAEDDQLILLFNYTVTDSHGATDVGTFTMNIVGVNDDPTAVDDAADATEDTPTVIDVLVNDFDVDNGETATLVVVDVSTTSDAEVTWD